jgi:predicted membrane channel-forming protein YqfA (hemolysin III family)
MMLKKLCISACLTAGLAVLMYIVHFASTSVYAKQCIWTHTASPHCTFLLSVVTLSVVSVQHIWKVASLSLLGWMALGGVTLPNGAPRPVPAPVMRTPPEDPTKQTHLHQL